jgi:hypothetical protein
MYTLFLLLLYYTLYLLESIVFNETRNAEIFQKSRSNNKILRITVQNVHVMVAWHLVFVHPWLRHEEMMLILVLNRLKKAKMTLT